MELEQFILNKLLEIVAEVKKYDPETDYLSISYMGDFIHFHNNYFENPKRIKIDTCYYEKNYAEQFNDADPILSGIKMFEEK